MSRANGTSTADAAREALTDALASERELAERAAEIRGDATELTPALFLELAPLLREPIPAGFIQHTPVVTGKPYESTGIRSVQVCVDRMDAVLTPLWWYDEVVYDQDGKVATVTVVVEMEHREIRRTARGGVDRGSTLGNVYKGSYTNAAKRAFAMLGVGHEVYLGATDADPDVDESAAKLQAQSGEPDAPPADRLTRAQTDRVAEAFENAGIPVDGDDFKLYLRAAGVDSLADLTASSAFKLRELLDAETVREAAS